MSSDKNTLAVDVSRVERGNHAFAVWALGVLQEDVNDLQEELKLTKSLSL